MSDRFSAPTPTFAALKVDFDLHFQEMSPDMRERIKFVQASGYSERCAEQSEKMGQLCVLTMLFGSSENAGYLARCAFALARNSVQVLETGWKTDAYTDWVKGVR